MKRLFFLIPVLFLACNSQEAEQKAEVKEETSRIPERTEVVVEEVEVESQIGTIVESIPPQGKRVTESQYYKNQDKIEDMRGDYVKSLSGGGETLQVKKHGDDNLITVFNPFGMEIKLQINDYEHSLPVGALMTFRVEKGTVFKASFVLTGESHKTTI